MQNNVGDVDLKDDSKPKVIEIMSFSQLEEQDCQSVNYPTHYAFQKQTVLQELPSSKLSEEVTVERVTPSSRQVEESVKNIKLIASLELSIIQAMLE